MKSTVLKPTMNGAKKSTNGKATNGKADKAKPHAAHGLHEFFVAQLKDIYWAEKMLTKALPKMIKNATDEELVAALTGHLEETKEQETRLEEVFAAIDEKAVAKKCEAMEGILKEAEQILEETEKGSVRDAGIICARQKVEHYEMATYGSLCGFAKTLGAHEAAALLQETLDEETGASEKLASIATTHVNNAASRNDGHGDAQDAMYSSHTKAHAR